MKFGKLADVSTVDFSLGPIPEFSKDILSNLNPNKKDLSIYYGCTGWTMKDWLGIYYPSKTPSNQFLYYYGQQFNTIELNTTHYRIPDETLIEKWYADTPADFKFCPKIPRSISHRNDLGIGSKQFALFCSVIQGLKDKLGPCFMQLPPYFGPSKLPILEAFLAQFPTDIIPLSIEVRQADWFGSVQLERLLRCLKKHQVGTIFSDVAGRRDALHQGLTNDTVQIRFVGNSLHRSDYDRIDAWIDRWLQWFDQGIRKLYFFAHQPDSLLAPELCIYLQNQIEAKSDFVFKRKTRPFNDGQLSLF